MSVPPSRLAQAVANYRRDVARGEAVAMAAIHAAYEDARPRVLREIEALMAAIDERDEITQGQAVRLSQLDRLLEVIDEDLNAMGRQVESMITGAQSKAVDASIERTRQMAAARATSASDAAAIARNWVDVPRQQLEHLIGSLSDGSPLRESLSMIGPDTADAVRNALADGIVRLIPTKQLGAGLARQLNLSEARAQTLARTAVQQAARNAQLEQMAQNDDILDGWEWFSALDSRTCLSCVAQHGVTFPLSESQFPAHPNCRCVAVPVLSDYPDQGIGPTGEEWFATLPADQQDAMLPVWARDEYRAGRVRISDFAQEHQSANYGRSFLQATRLQAEANAARRSGSGGGSDSSGSADAGEMAGKRFLIQKREPIGEFSPDLSFERALMTSVTEERAREWASKEGGVLANETTYHHTSEWAAKGIRDKGLNQSQYGHFGNLIYTTKDVSPAKTGIGQKNNPYKFKIVGHAKSVLDLEYDDGPKIHDDAREAGFTMQNPDDADLARYVRSLGYDAIRVRGGMKGPPDDDWLLFTHREQVMLIDDES